MDRITRIRIKNVRAIEELDLELAHPITVLIGENGSGKSTIIECLEILRKLHESNGFGLFFAIHRGFAALLRRGAKSLTLGITVEDSEGQLPRLTYDLTLAADGSNAVVQEEILHAGPDATTNAATGLAAELTAARDRVATGTTDLAIVDGGISNVTADVQRSKSILDAHGGEEQRQKWLAAKNAVKVAKEARQVMAEHLRETREQVAELSARADRGREEPLVVMQRTGAGALVYDINDARTKPVPIPVTAHNRLFIASYGEMPPHPAIRRLLDALRGIEVQLDFDTRASWAARFYQRPETLRGASVHFPAERLDLLGVNLANAWAELRNRDDWSDSLDLARLGLGRRLQGIRIIPDRGGGNVYLAVSFEDLAEPILASDLSDGQLSWLAFVAMTRLNQGRSLLAVDEPELHLHPTLVGRVISMLGSLEGGAPTLVATHSDRVLASLDDPAAAVRVCSIEQGKAVVRGLDRAELASWLEEFGDLGQLRASGYLGRAIAPDEPETPPGTDE
jgi:predicted ATPase